MSSVATHAPAVQLWTVRQVQKYFQVAPRTVYRWVRAGVIPPAAVVRLTATCTRFRPELLLNVTPDTPAPAPAAAPAPAPAPARRPPAPAPVPPDGTRPACRACGRRLVTRPRGLCYRCSAEPEVRERFPVAASKFNRRGVGNGVSRAALPDVPTPVEPGTPEKVAVLMKRAARGEQLFHPADAWTPRHGGRVVTTHRLPRQYHFSPDNPD